MAATVKSYVQHLGKNPRGRDFVAGDIHGCFSSLRFALQGVGFDTADDRLFCVGDLVDRGPESHMAAGLLRQSWFYSVRGNHEDLILQTAHSNEQIKPGRNRKGAAWLWGMDPQFRLRLSHQLAELPIVIEVETETGLVGLVHGDVP